MVGTTMVGHIHIMIIELLMKLDVILKTIGCTVTKMLDQNNFNDFVEIDSSEWLYCVILFHRMSLYLYVLCRNFIIQNGCGSCYFYCKKL